jgi:hypothetical protein
VELSISGILDGDEGDGGGAPEVEGGIIGADEQQQQQQQQGEGPSGGEMTSDGCSRRVVRLPLPATTSCHHRRRRPVGVRGQRRASSDPIDDDAGDRDRGRRTGRGIAPPYRHPPAA